MGEQDHGEDETPILTRTNSFVDRIKNVNPLNKKKREKERREELYRRRVALRKFATEFIKKKVKDGSIWKLTKKELRNACKEHFGDAYEDEAGKQAFKEVT